MTFYHNTQVVLGIDVGTTNLKCFAYDRNAKILGSASAKIAVVTVEDKTHEIEPERLWNTLQDVVQKCFKTAELTANDVSCLGISTQRGTFLTWNGESSEHFHNFITWKDTRSENLCMRWNASFLMKLFKFAAYALYFFTRIKYLGVASAMKFSPEMVLPRLYMLIQENKTVRDKIFEKDALFGTLDTWLVWKLTGGKVHATEGSNACVTGFFDPFGMKWVNWILRLFSIPTTIFPTVKNTCDYFGETTADIFGASIPICAVIGDQQASLIGSGCLRELDISCTMGTGTFATVNTGSSMRLLKGGYPLIGWTISSKPTYVLECGIHDSANTIEIALNLGECSHPSKANKIVQSVKDTDEVFFLPGKSEIEEPNGQISSAFVGVKSETTKAHLIRSVMESLGFQMCSLLESIYKYFKISANKEIKVAGGVSNCDFLLQLIANVTNCKVSRMKHNECSSLGAAFLAGLCNGVWKSIEDINDILNQSDTFIPTQPAHFYSRFNTWRKKCRSAILF